MSARIYQRLPNPMQSGRANAAGWVLEHDVLHAWRADPLTGWQGSGDTLGQVSIRFPSREAAIGYAEHMGLAYHVVAAARRQPKTQPYAANFLGGAVDLPRDGEG